MGDLAADGVLSDLLTRFAEVPERLAVVVGDRTLTYREFDTATAALAGRLKACGVGTGRVALIRMRQSIDTVVAMVATLRAGGAWCVLEPGYPDEWVRTLLRDIDCGAIIYDGSGEPELGPRTAALADGDRRPPVVDIASGEGGTAGIDSRPPESAPAYVITTSGSTGAPKAVVVSLANLANLVSSRDYPLPPHGPVSFSPLRLTWDGSLIQSVWALCAGGTAVLPDDATLADAEAAAALASKHLCSHLCATPSFYRLLLPHLANTGDHLGTVALAGEVLPPDLVHGHRAILPDATLINEYGPTEATGTVLGHEIREAPGDTVPIGVPLGRSTAYLLTDRLHAADPGERAALALGGPQVADGYAARPGDTASRFVADPFTDAPGARMYLTGDVASRNTLGQIEFHGRTDSQVKVRGIRVECEAVAATLRRHPDVGDAAVLVAHGRGGDQYLAACWIAADAETPPPSTGDLLEHCREHLPAYSIPSRLLRVESLPLASSGKVDVAALRTALSEATGRENAQRRTRWTPEQRAVAEIWADVLGHDDFDLDDPFLRIGGNSHRVVELHLRLERHRPGAIRVGQLFDASTIRTQAEILSTAPELPAAPEQRPIVFEL